MRVFWAMVIKETARFLVVPIQTVFTPLVSAFLYIVIFGITMGERISFPYEISYRAYVTSGLVIMYVLLHSFQNSTSSIIISKYRLNIVDTVTYPIGRPWLVLAFGLGGMVRGLVVGGVVWLLGLLFVPGLHHHVGLFVLSAGLGGLLFSLLGTWLGFACRSFDQISIYTNFIVTPVLYLSGVFFPVTLLDEPWKTVSQLNPIVYLVETARYALTGSAHVALLPFFVFVPLAIGVVWIGATLRLKKGIPLR